MMTQREDRGEGKEMSELDRLYSLVREYRRSDEFMELLRVIRGFPNISPYNAFLLAQQRPGARYVMGAAEWRRLGREIRPHSRPMVILQPFGPVRFVYDIGDTMVCDGVERSLFDDDDAAVIERLSHPYRTCGGEPGRWLGCVMRGLEWYGVSVMMTRNGSELGAMIELLSGGGEMLDVRLPKGRSVGVRALYRITINDRAEEGEVFASVCHEMAHLLCRHLGKAGPEFPDGVRLNRAAMEFEAEATAWIVCERLGVRNPSEVYLAGYVASNGDIPEGVSPERIFSAATTLLNLSYGKASVKDGWLYKFDRGFRESCRQRK